MKQVILNAIAAVTGAQTAFAHCDIPCGIYDPHQAQIGALTVIRMDKLIAEQQNADHDHNHDISRMIAVKEEHAELTKREIRVIWGDFFKPEHISKYPDIHELVYSIMQAASKAKQDHNVEDGEKLLDLVNKFAEIFWEIKGFQTKKAPAPYEPKSEVIYPVL